MAEAFFSNGVINSGGGLSLGASASLPAGQIFGRFYFDTSNGSFYFDDGTQWVAVGGGGGGTPTLQEVTDAGNTTTNEIIPYSIRQEELFGYIFSQRQGVNDFVYVIPYQGFINYQLNSGTINYGTKDPIFTARVGGVTGASGTINMNAFNYSAYESGFYLQSINAVTININNLPATTSTYRARNTITPSVGSTFNFQYLIDYTIAVDATGGGGGGAVNVTNRYGFYIQDFRNLTWSYTNIYTIYSPGNIPMYHAGIGFFGTLTNLATTNVALSLGKPINFENSTAATAGGNSGSHLIVYVNGVQRKITLLLP